MKLFWGYPNNYINITNICYEKLLFNNSITINKSEEYKLNIFGDPMPGLIKHIKIFDNYGNYKIFNSNEEDIVINIYTKFEKGIDIFWNDFNITDICLKKCLNGNILTIPSNEEERLHLFSDPYPGIIKDIKIIDKYGFSKIFDNENDIILDINKILDKNLEIYFGILDNYTNITEICYEFCSENNYLFIPKEENEKLNLFGDPLIGIKKHIKTVDKLGNYKIYNSNEQIFIPSNIIFYFEYKEFEIDYLYKNLYEYERDIPNDNLNQLKLYNKNCEDKLDFKNMEQKIKNENFTKAVFHDLLDKDKYLFDKSKLITLDIILNKSFSFKCIKSGNLYRSSKSFHFLIKNKTELSASEFDDIVVYIFDNIDEPFFVVMGAGSNYMVLHTHILFIYYFKSNELFYIKYFDHWLDTREKICNNILDFYNNNIINDSIKITTIFGYSINIAHSYWNDISGFKFLLDLDLLKLIDTLIIGPYDYYNLSKYLEKNNVKYIREDNLELINKYINDNNLLYFKYNEIFMYEDLKIFVIKNNIYTNEEEINYINEIKEKYFPIITFNLRAVYRNLYNQEEKISNIINKLYKVYPKMFVIFDGYIKNENVNIQNYISEGNISNKNIFDSEYTKILNNILNNINTKNYISLIGSTLERQIAWLDISNYGILQIGAGSHNFKWLLNKPCINIGKNNIINENILVYSFHDLIFREKCNFNSYINPSIINFKLYKNPNNEFDIDWFIIFKFIYKDLLILKENNYKILQYENINKYPIYHK